MEGSRGDIGELWKLCGRETEAGKLLYSLYNSSHKPVISYPKVKTKTPQQMADEEARKKAAQKGCPQRAYVDVPSVKKENKRKFHMIDCVPKRKTETDIKQEIKEHYQHKLVPPQKGKNREEMKSTLQEKFQFGNQGDPKKRIKSQVKGGFIVPEFAKEHIIEKFGEETELNPRTEKEITENKKLEEMYDQILQEIEERQQHLEEMTKLGQGKQIEARIKKEIRDRFAEIDKIRLMLRK